MQCNLGAVLDRGQMLDALGDSSECLSSQSKMFYKSAKSQKSMLGSVGSAIGGTFNWISSKFKCKNIDQGGFVIIMNMMKG